MSARRRAGHPETVRVAPGLLLPRGAALPAVTLRTKTPCCGRRVIIQALVDVPRETYDRQCAGCGRPWIVERHLGAEHKGVRIDILTWEAAT